MSHAEQARTRATAATAELEAAEKALHAARERARECKIARATASTATTDKAMRDLIANDDASAERLALCESAQAAAVATLDQALRGVVAADRADVVAAQYQKGIAPILEIEVRLRRLADEADHLRRRQLELFANEVAPRAPIWTRVPGRFDPEPLGFYVSVADVVAKHPHKTAAVSEGRS